MARGLLIVLTFVVVAAFVALASADASAVVAADPGAPAAQAVAGEVIVGFSDEVSEAARDRVLREVGAVEQQELEEIQAELVEVGPGEVGVTIKELEADPRVDYAEPNYVLSVEALPPTDSNFDQLWGLNNDGQVVNGGSGVRDADVDALEAWELTTGSASVAVAVVDTGVDFGHPDLGGSVEGSSVLWINGGEDCPGCRTDGVDNDRNGYVDDWRGWDFANDDNDPTDDSGHGTHVAGTIGAIGDNGIGVVGVNWAVRIVALKFLDAGGSGTTADAVEAVLYASRMGIRVINASWGGAHFSQSLLDAFREADSRGSLFVAAAGNDGRNSDEVPQYPAGYDLPNIVSVTATDSADRKAVFSQGAGPPSTWARPGCTCTRPGQVMVIAT
jgi:subtilisin family serine protease